MMQRQKSQAQASSLGFEFLELEISLKLVFFDLAPPLHRLNNQHFIP